MFSSCLCSDDWKNTRNVYIHVRWVTVSCKGKRNWIKPYFYDTRFWVGKHQCSSIRISKSQSVWLLFPLRPKYLLKYSEEWSGRCLQNKVALSLRKLSAPAFLPPGEIFDAFIALSTNIPTEVEPVCKYFGETCLLGRLIVARGKGRPRRNQLHHPPWFPRLCGVFIIFKPTTLQEPTTWRLGIGDLKRYLNVITWECIYW